MNNTKHIQAAVYLKSLKEDLDSKEEFLKMLGTNSLEAMAKTIREIEIAKAEYDAVIRTLQMLGLMDEIRDIIKQS